MFWRGLKKKEKNQTVQESNVVSIAITSDEFSKILKEKKFIYEKNPHIAVGVSGGVDSVALLLLVNRWIKDKKGLLTAIHFNHKIRKGSNLDADFVKNLS